jgi:two-component system, NtrC family, response regulator AtoC
VDDDVLVLSIVTDSLSAQGMEVQTAVDGSHALQKIATAEPRYDVLIVDARMPNLDGRGFIVHARAAGYKGKIIIFSAHLDADERQRYKDLMIDRIIEKPPRAGELAEVIRQVTDRHE